MTGARFGRRDASRCPSMLYSTSAAQRADGPLSLGEILGPCYQLVRRQRSDRG